MNRQRVTDSALEPVVKALSQLSLQSQETVTALVMQLAEREGINAPLTVSSGLQTPTERILR